MARPLVPEPRMALVSPVAAAMLADLKADLGLEALARVVSCSDEIRAAQALAESLASDLTPALRAIDGLTSRLPTLWRDTA
jgi:hypothetical protein